MSLETVRGALPDAARDLKLNLESVLAAAGLTAPQRWTIALACAIATRHRSLIDAVSDAAREAVDPAVAEAVIGDATAAAALMAMNNVFYRFRHMSGKPSYAERPARLRMNRLARPATSKLDFELACLAVSALNGCETCVQAHERVVLEGGLTEEQVLDAVRIAAVMSGVATGLAAASIASAPAAVASAVG